MSSASSKKVIFAAMLGNGLIAVTKFLAAAYTNSSAMLSEGVHSLVDVGNQGLLLYGMKQSERPADDKHPFGYGMELYFWAFVVAVLIFSVGAGVSFYEGIHKVMNPHPIEKAYVNYIVLGLAIVFEGFSWWVAFKEFMVLKGEGSILSNVRESKDPTIFTVLFEDTAAMLGLVVALIGIFIGQVLGIPEMDGVASIVIGVILAMTAVFLAYESKALLIGEGASPKIVEGIKRIVDKQSGIECINDVITMHMSPRDILVNMSLDFQDSLSAGKVEEIITILELKIKKEFPEVNRVFIEIQSSKMHGELK